jgi:hypothetical protein
MDGTAAANQCLADYFSAWNKYCSSSKYGVFIIENREN